MCGQSRQNTRPTARPIAAQFPRHGCMDDLKTERGFAFGSYVGH